MVQQITRPPTQAAGAGRAGGYPRQTTKCLNCGFGRGQFGVEFCDDYCSLDCYTSAKVTGRNLPRDTRHRRRYEPEAAPWPRGLLVEAPPSPKPWRGRAWSNDSSWRTVFSSDLTTDDSSSQESVVEWHAIGGSLAGDGPMNGAGSGRRVDGAPRGYVPGNTTGGGGAIGSGGGTALGNGVSGGGNAGVGGGRNNNNNVGFGAVGKEGGGNAAGVNGRVHWEDTVVRVVGSSGGPGGVAANHHYCNNGVGVSSTEEVGRGVGGGTGNAGGCRDLPPLAPVPRAGAFPQQRRVHGVRRVEGRPAAASAVAITTSPSVQQAITPHAPSVGAGKQSLPRLSSFCVDQTMEEPKGCGFVTQERARQSKNISATAAATATTAPMRQEQAAAGTTAKFESRGGGGGGSRQIGDDNAEVSKPLRAFSVEGKGGLVAFGGVAAVKGGEEKTETMGEKEAEGGAEVEQRRSDGPMIATRCGAAAGLEAGAVDLAGVVIWRDSERTNPTRAVVRQWRHMFLP